MRAGDAAVPGLALLCCRPPRGPGNVLGSSSRKWGTGLLRGRPRERRELAGDHGGPSRPGSCSWAVVPEAQEAQAPTGKDLVQGPWPRTRGRDGRAARGQEDGGATAQPFPMPCNKRSL